MWNYFSSPLKSHQESEWDFIKRQNPIRMDEYRRGENKNKVLEADKPAVTDSANEIDLSLANCGKKRTNPVSS